MHADFTYMYLFSISHTQPLSCVYVDRYHFNTSFTMMSRQPGAQIPVVSCARNVPKSALASADFGPFPAPDFSDSCPGLRRFSAICWRNGRTIYGDGAKQTVKKFKNIGAHFFVRFFYLPHPALPYLRFCPCLLPPADWLLRCMRWYSYVHCGCVLLLVGVSIY